MDVTLIRYMTPDEVRVLTAVEMGMKNHELVPKALINSISGIRIGNLSKVLMKLTQNKLLSYERGNRFDGYRLTYKGYDFLALNVLSNRNVITSIGNQIGVGKESDVYVGGDPDGKAYAVKLHRLGRTCFRTVSTKRDYQKNGHKTNWIYLSRLAAKRELAFMKLLYDNQVPIPEPIDCNRHCLVMELIDGTLMNHLTREDIPNRDDVEALYDKLMNMIIRLANDFGVIHGDFNEFNLLLKTDTFDPILIDFPQMISIYHSSAQTYFDRDVRCVVDFFAKRFGYESDFIPCFEVIDKESDKKQDIGNEIGLSSEGEQSGSDVEKSDQEFEDEVKVNERNVENEDENDKYIENRSIDDIKSDVEISLAKQLEGIEVKEVLDDKDSDDNSSRGGGLTSIATTFTTEEIKDKLKKERKRIDTRQKVRCAKKNIKGDNSAFARRRKENLATLKDDVTAYQLDKRL